MQDQDNMVQDKENIRGRIRRFIEDNYLFDDDSSLSDFASLSEAGLIDSTGILELLAYLESEFDLKIEDAEVIPDNFDTIFAIASFVSAKRAAAVTPSPHARVTQPDVTGR